MAARSVTVTVVNCSKVEWKRTDLKLLGGIWGPNGGTVPPEVIAGQIEDDDGEPIRSEVVFGSESNGFATGTEGWVTYTGSKKSGESIGLMKIHWNNPFSGGNGFGVDFQDQRYTANVGNSVGNNATVLVDIHKKP
jgi:Aegerolysin